MIRKPTNGKSAKRFPRRATMSGPSTDNGMIHIIGGRFNTFEYNTDLHHVYLPASDTWKDREPLPTPRSGHGLVVYRDRFFAMGGEYGVQDKGQISQGAVFGQMESYDPQTNTWQSHAPMTTPRHAVGATTIGDAIYVAGGGAVTGGLVHPCTRRLRWPLEHVTRRRHENLKHNAA